MTTVTHPAKFTPAVLETIGWFVHREVDKRYFAWSNRTVLDEPPPRRLRVLDPFAGVGGIHGLAHRYGSTYLETVGVELEPEWSRQPCEVVAVLRKPLR